MELFSMRSIIIFTSLMFIFNRVDTTNFRIKTHRKWFIGRVPPSSFEYPKLNGFYSPKQAKYICEKDLQCGGFTFKGALNATYFVPEIYFFHFINETANYLTTEIKYPHWTTYLVGSRDYVVISGTYSSDKNSEGESVHKE